MHASLNHGISLVTILFLSVFGLHCEHVGPLELEPEPGEEAPGLADIESALFATNCALSGCHAGSNALMGLDLSPGQSYGSMVNVKSREMPDLFLVDPGNPDGSYLIDKLEGSAGMAPGTLRMPIGREPLSAEAIDLVREWILAGAPQE